MDPSGTDLARARVTLAIAAGDGKRAFKSETAEEIPTKARREQCGGCAEIRLIVESAAGWKGGKDATGRKKGRNGRNENDPGSRALVPSLLRFSLCSCSVPSPHLSLTPAPLVPLGIAHLPFIDSVL